MILVDWSQAQWADFDGWCAARGVDPMDLPAPRFVNLIYHRLCDGLDRPALEKLDSELDRLSRLADPPKVHQPAEVTPGGIWKKAPPGWTPPGWKSDEENWKNIQATGLIGKTMTSGAPVPEGQGV